MSQLSESTLTCGRHSQIPATHYCAKCAMPLCDNCARPQSDGTIKCPTCSVGARLPEAPRPRIPVHSPLVSHPCAQHPEVKTIRRCSGCGAHTCETCSFTLEGNLHICPTCAMKGPTGLSSSRKKLVIVGMLLAVWSTVATGLMATGYLAGSSEAAAGLAFSFLIFFPTLIGFAVSLSAQERRLQNPALVWVAVAWNTLLLIGFVALIVIGNLSNG